MSDENQSPQQRIAEVASRLAEYLKRYDAAHDTRAAFAYTYFRLTTELEGALRSGDPVFTDPLWVADLAASLASEYFVAMDGIDNWITTRPNGRGAQVKASDLPDSIPQPWREVYAASSTGRSYVLEDVLFAMMAHISYDLPVALRRLSDRTNVRCHIADYHQMNSVLGAAIDGIQDELASRYSRGLADLDRLFTREDELLSNYGIRVSRGMAWYNFERLLDPSASEQAVRSIRTSTGALINEVQAPDDWKLRLALQLARRLIPSRRQWPATDRPGSVALGKAALRHEAGTAASDPFCEWGMADAAVGEE